MPRGTSTSRQRRASRPSRVTSQTPTRQHRRVDVVGITTVGRPCEPVGDRDAFQLSAHLCAPESRYSDPCPGVAQAMEPRQRRWWVTRPFVHPYGSVGQQEEDVADR